MNKTLISTKSYYFSSNSEKSVSLKLNELNDFVEKHNSENLKKFNDFQNMDSLIQHALSELSLIEYEVVNFCEFAQTKQSYLLETKISFIYKISKYLISK